MPERGWIDRRGTVYVLVLVSVMIVTVVGLSGMAVIASERRSAQLDAEAEQARLHAHSAVEAGLLIIASDADWRTNSGGGNWLNAKAVGAGLMSLDVADPGDGDVADSPDDPVTLTGTGEQGAARQKVSVTLVARAQPVYGVGALKMAAHTSGAVTVESGRRLRLGGETVSADGTLTNFGTIDGAVEALAIVNVGTISGSQTILAPAKPIPGASIVSDYQAMASVIPSRTAIDNQVIAPGLNPWGSPNANGIYYLDTGNQDLDISDTRIHGTLVVRCGAFRRVRIRGQVFLHTYQPNLPALIVDGNIELDLRSATETLSEATHAVNFNPIGAPYNGEFDGDRLDQYPSEIHGLVHATGSVVMYNTSRVRGAVLAGGGLTVKGTNEIVYDPNLYTAPPPGYEAVPGAPTMVIDPASWRRVVD